MESDVFDEFGDMMRPDVKSHLPERAKTRRKRVDRKFHAEMGVRRII